MIAPMESCIHHDAVEAFLRMPLEPSPSVVSDDCDFGVLQKACRGFMPRNGLKVTGVDIDDGQLAHERIVGDDLRPGAGSKSDHQNARRSGMESAQRKWADDHIDIV